MIEIENQHRDRIRSLGLDCAQLERILYKSATAQQTRKMISASSSAIDVNVMVFDHQHNDESGSHRVKYRLEREYRQPCGLMFCRQERVHSERYQEIPACKNGTTTAAAREYRVRRLSRHSSMAMKNV